MKYLIEPTKKLGWVSAENCANESELVKKILSADTILSDLDGTDTSAAKQVFFDFLKEPKYFLNPAFLAWLACAGGNYVVNVLHGQNAESQIAREFICKFLRQEKDLSRITSKYDEEFARSTLFSGIKEFYGLLPNNSLKIYVSRNIKDVLQAYMQATKSNEALSEQFDKKKSVEKIIKKYPNQKKFVVRGDTVEDEEMADYLKYLKLKETIDDVIFIHVAKNSRHYNPRADLNTSRNHGALNYWLKNTPVL